MVARDNIAGIKKGGIIKNTFLAPGKVIQWINYMTVGQAKGYGKVRTQTRLSRSPLMTYVYSTIFWLGMLLIIFVIPLTEGSDLTIWDHVKSGIM